MNDTELKSVFLVMYDDGDGDEIYGVYTTLEGAEKLISEFLAPDEGYFISEVPLNVFLQE